MLGLIKGRKAKELSDEGFVSYYMDTPLAVFPRLHPPGLPRGLPPSVLRSVPLRNLPLAVVERRKRGPEGNRRQYEVKVEEELRKLGGHKEALLGEGEEGAEGAEGAMLTAAGGASLRDLDLIKLGCISRLCAVAQTFAYAGREDVGRVVHGEEGRRAFMPLPAPSPPLRHPARLCRPS